MVLIITISTFVAITFGVMALYWLVYRPQSAAAERIAAPIHKLLPPSAAEAKKLQKLLMHAGHRGPNAAVIYRALQMTALVMFPAAVAITFTFMGWSLKSG